MKRIANFARRLIVRLVFGVTDYQAARLLRSWAVSFPVSEAEQVRLTEETDRRLSELVAEVSDRRNARLLATRPANEMAAARASRVGISEERLELVDLRHVPAEGSMLRPVALPQSGDVNPAVPDHVNKQPKGKIQIAMEAAEARKLAIEASMGGFETEEASFQFFDAEGHRSNSPAGDLSANQEGR